MRKTHAIVPDVTPALPVAEAATQARGVANLLRTVSARFAPSPEIDTTHKVLPEERSSHSGSGANLG
jgi:hypothetical protein